MPNGTIPSWIPVPPVVGVTYTSLDGTLAVTYVGDNQFVAVPPPIPSNGLTRHFESLVELQTQEGRYDGDTCILSGYYAGNPIGGGWISVWNATSTATAAGAVVVQVTGVDVGRWLMRLEGFVTPEMFGAQSGQNIATALIAADTYCQLTGLTLRGGSAGGLLSTPVLLRSPYIDMANYEIQVSSPFPAANAVTYRGLTNDLSATALVSMRFTGNRDSQVSEIVSFKLEQCPTADSLFNIYGYECNTLVEMAGNVERIEMHIKGNFVNCLCKETGESPDTNRIYISGGRFKRIYHKTSSTTSQVTVNCQAQEDGSSVYPIEINGARATTLAGEIRGIINGAVKMADVPKSSFDSLTFAAFNVQGGSGTAPVLSIDTCNYVSGDVTITHTGADCQPVELLSVDSADLSVALLDCEHAGYQVSFGKASDAKGTNGKFTLTDRGAVGGTKAALIDSTSNLSVEFFGSALPIDISSTVNNDVVNLSVEREYIVNNVAINAGSVRAYCRVRGMFTTGQILAYSTPFRGMEAVNLNTNGICFYSGTAWQRYTTSTLV